MTTVSVNPNVPQRFFGAIRRPFNPAELKYAALFRPPPKADFNQPVGIPKDRRSPIWDQGSTSSCTASICEALESAAALQGRSVVQLSHEQVYYNARARQTFFGQGAGADTGAYTADVCDEALQGIGQESLQPFDGNVGDAPSAAVQADRVNQVWLARHRPIYPGPGALAQVWDALNQGWPVVMGWVIDASMYDPKSMPYRRGLNPQAAGQHGYHQSYICRMRRWPGDGRLYLGIPNSWGEQYYNPRMADWWPEEARAGEAWADAEDWLERTTSPIYELRALEMLAYTAPQPEPQPEPNMDVEQFRQRVLDLIATREQEQYAAESRYYSEGDPYRGDQCWWRAVGFGELGQEIADLAAAAKPTAQPRGPRSAA